MKRLFFLLIVAVASVLPQSVWAQAVLSDNNTTLTITTTATSQVSGYVAALRIDNAELTPVQKAAITKIVFVGKFNEGDIAVVKSTGDGAQFTGVTEVDMAEAKFVTTTGGEGAPSQATYYLYHSALPASANIGDRAIVGATLYESARVIGWVELSEGSKPNEGTSVIEGIDNTVANPSGYAIGSYGKNSPVYKWVQMQVTDESWSGPSKTVPEGATVVQQDMPLTATTTEDAKLNEVIHDYYNNQTVWFYRYYTCESDESGYHWVRKTSFSGTVDFANIVPDASLDDLEAGNDRTNANEGNNGKTMSVRIYYTKVETSRNWGDPYETNDVNYRPDGEGSKTTLDGDFIYRNAHKNDIWGTVIKNGDWVRLRDWTYYRLLEQDSWYWKQTSYMDGENDINYANGESHWIIRKYTNGTDMSSVSDGLPNQANQYAVVMGTEKLYNGTGWTDPGIATEMSNYSDMKFSYWSSTLERAITSKYADENINSDIFANCKALTYVDFKAGVVKGFGDHKQEVGYTANSLEVNIGKNVTKIGSDAFLRCDALKKVTFDAGNGSADAITGRSYPLDLVIDNGAFQDCVNLKGITIPNRVSEIGNNTFKSAGNSTDEFVVNFQRRYEGSTSSTPIEGYNGTLLTIGADAFGYCSKLKHISLPIRMTSMGNSIFENSGLESFEIREDIEDALVKTIPSNAFLSCQLTEINIPRSVTLIEGGAFSNTPTMRTIRFQQQIVEEGTTQEPLIIKEGAFAGGNEQNQVLKDVYVDFLPSERMVICEYNAFNFTSLVGQTNEGSRQMAKLHFPEDAWDYYQGDWKRGLAFRQSNLNDFKDGYNGYYGGVEGQGSCVGKGTTIDETSTATGKYTKEGYSGDAKYIAPANGWQQFAYSDTDIDILIPWGSFMRTFSTTTPYVIPTYATTETSNGITVQKDAPMFKIYRITAFSDGYEEGQDKRDAQLAQASTRVAKALEVNDNDRSGRAYIPSETGLMMVGLINADYIVYFADADFTSGGSEKTEKKYPYNISGYTDASPSNMNVNDGTDINLLYPACIDNQRMDGLGGTSEAMTGEPTIGTYDGVSKILLRSSIPCPYHSYDSDLKFRLFCYYSTPNQFKRVNNGKVTRDKAYLKLPKELFHWSNEYTSGEAGGSTSGVTDPTAAAAAREISLNFFDDDEESETTGIKQVDTTAQRTDSNVFYTLEGVKLNNRPTQRGIYIHNGRKVVIK